MKVCIVGAGSIGGFIGTRLALAAQAEVSAFARGETLRALREHGWRLQTGGELLSAPALAEGDAKDLGKQDLVIIAVKAQSLHGVVKSIAPLLGQDTIVLPAMNGVPWWFCENLPGFDGRPIEAVDQGGAIGRAIPFKQILGCVVHASCAMPEPGLVQHNMGDGLIIGEPAGGSSARALEVVKLLADAGFSANESSDIRQDIWYKLWGNMTINPVSAITGATVDRILADTLVRDFCSSAMREAADIGRALGCVIEQSAEERHAITAKLGAFRTSMLQDVQAGRSIELDAIVSAVHEIGARVNIPCPSIAALLGLTRLFGRVHELYPQDANQAKENG